MQGISIKPSEAVSGGGLIEAGIVTLKSVRVAPWDYNGKAPNPVCALKVEMEAEDGTLATQYYSAGDLSRLVPSQDGKRFVPVTAAGLNNGTNAVMFLASMVNAGFPEDKLFDDVSVFDGCVVHVHTVPQPKRSGLGASAENKTILVAQKIVKLPWESGGAAPAQAKTKAATKTAAPAPAQEAAAAQAPAPTASLELATKAVEGLMAIVVGKGGTIAKAQLAQEAFKHWNKDPDRNQLVQLVYSDAFLKQEGLGWSFDGSTVSLG